MQSKKISSRGCTSHSTEEAEEAKAAAAHEHGCNSQRTEGTRTGNLILITRGGTRSRGTRTRTCTQTWAENGEAGRSESQKFGAQATPAGLYRCRGGMDAIRCKASPRACTAVTIIARHRLGGKAPGRASLQVHRAKSAV